MTKEEKDVIQAARIIKRYCRKQNYCDICPLFFAERCGVSDVPDWIDGYLSVTPSEWMFQGEEEEEDEEC